MTVPARAFLLLLLLPACHPTPRARPVIRGAVVHIVDGDTLDVQPRAGGPRIRVRLLGIDCPESQVNEKCMREGARGGPSCAAQLPAGRAAARRATQLVSNPLVTLEPVGSSLHDRYGRLLAYVRLAGGADLGLLLLLEGFCADYSSAFPHPREAQYREATHFSSPHKATERRRATRNGS